MSGDRLLRRAVLVNECELVVYIMMVGKIATWANTAKNAFWLLLCTLLGWAGSAVVRWAWPLATIAYTITKRVLLNRQSARREGPQSLLCTLFGHSATQRLDHLPGGHDAVGGGAHDAAGVARPLATGVEALCAECVT